jgi:hypothetical protein
MKPLVRNAADAEQVEGAKFSADERRRREIADLRDVLSTRSGRRFLWRLLSHCRPFASIWESSARIHYNSGQQDVGHFILSEIQSADQESFFLMMKENKEGELKNV